MTKIVKKLSSILILLVAMTIAEAGQPNIIKSNFDWLAGRWKADNGSEIYYEKWDIQNDTLMSGNAFGIINGDTFSRESISMISNADSIFYIPTVFGQNNDKPIYFNLISKLNDIFIFENLEHDFPQRIIYEFRRPDSLIASIEGYTKGKYKQLFFKMKRIMY